MGIFGNKTSSAVQIKGRKNFGSSGGTITATGEPLVGQAVGAYAQVLAPKKSQVSDYNYKDPHQAVQEGPKGQMGLFDVSPAKGPEISHLYATPGYEHLVPAVLGQTLKESQGKWGVSPGASPDLSANSRKVVKSAIRLGLVEPPKGNPSVKQTNAHTYENSKEMVHDAHSFNLSGEPFELGEASDYMRNKIRSVRSGRNLSQQQFGKI